MSKCAVCGNNVSSFAGNIVKGKSGEWVCKECLNRANIGVMKFASSNIPSWQIKSLIANNFPNQNNQPIDNSNRGPARFCSNCGKEVNGSFCQNCGAKIEDQSSQTTDNNANTAFQQPAQNITRKTPPKKKATGAIVACVVVCIFAFAAIMGVLFGEDSDGASSDNTSVQSIESNEKENKANALETQKQIYDKNGIKADFIKLYDPKIGVTAFCVSLKIENNTSEEITVSLSDGYVNDTAVTFTTGLPVTIASGKNAIGVYNFGYNGLGFDKIEDIEKIEFKIACLNENWSGLKKSEKIVLEFK